MTTKQRIGVGVAVAAALALGAWVWGSSVLMTLTGSAPGTSATSGLSYEVTPEGSRQIRQSTEFYDIAVKYPDHTTLALSSSAGPTAEAAALAAMEGWATQQVLGFIAMGDFANLTEEDKEMIGFNAGRKYTLDIDYTEYQSPQTVSYVFTAHIDTLGAHPNGYFKTFMFDKRTGKELTLGDIFEGDWLSYVSAESEAQVRAHIAEMTASAGADVSLFEEGLAPREGNFLSAYMDGGDIVILFDPYQVAAYAAGPQEVRIPRASVATMLRAEYR